MPYELLHFRDADNVLKEKKMLKDVTNTMDYIESALFDSITYGSLLKQSLSEQGWRENGTLSILPKRNYQYKGFKKGIAIEGSLAAYEFIHEGLFRLQIGYDQKKIDSGILLLTNLRGDKSPHGSTKELLEKEMEVLEPTISLPVSIALFQLV